MNNYIKKIILYITLLSNYAPAQTYDEIHRLKKETYPDGSIVTYTYDAAGNLEKIAITPSATRDEDEDGIPDVVEIANGGSNTGLDPDGDLDGDGKSNFEEYAFGLDLNKQDQVQPAAIGASVVENGRTYFQYHYRRPLGSALTYAPQVSSDLKNWNQGQQYFAQVGVIDNGDGTEKVTVKCLLPKEENKKLFFRVAVNK